MRFRCLAALVATTSLTLSLGSLYADDWPQWRGPNRDGKSAETGLLKQWPAEGPKLLWQRKDLGNGYSTPAVVGDRIYLISNRGTDDEFVQALAVEDGRQLWSTKIGKVGENQGPQYPGSRSTPTVAGNAIYVLGSDGDLACLDLQGNIRWQKQLRTDFGGKPGAWAYSESPLIDGDRLVCTPGGEKATLVALNKDNGEIVWQSTVPGGDEAAYSSVVTAEVDGQKQYVQFLQKGLVGIDAETGKFLWRYDKTAEGSPANIPTPVVKNNYVYSASRRGGTGLVKLSTKDGEATAEQVYFTAKLPNGIGGTVVLGDFLYGAASQGMICSEFLTGEIKWQDRSIGASSVCYADERLYLHGENGAVALIEATPEAYREVGRFTPPDQPDRGQSLAWTYPVVANGRLYIHDWGTLWVYDVKE